IRLPRRCRPGCYAPARRISTTAPQWNKPKDEKHPLEFDFEEELKDEELQNQRIRKLRTFDDALLEVMSEEERQKYAKDGTVNRAGSRIMTDRIKDIRKDVLEQIGRTPRVPPDSFWEEDEPEEEYITGEKENVEPFDEDDILSMAHGKLE